MRSIKDLLVVLSGVLGSCMERAFGNPLGVSHRACLHVWRACVSAYVRVCLCVCVMSMCVCVCVCVSFVKCTRIRNPAPVRLRQVILLHKMH